MKLIDVSTKTHPNTFTMIDDEDFEKISGYYWHAKNGWGCKYVVTTHSIRMHRLIMNAPSGSVVDHINGDTLDNRKANLRICSHKENSRNRKKPSNGASSQYKGVTRRSDKKTVVFVSQIRVGERCFRLGSFSSEVLAAIAYNDAALHHFGEFARLNIINGASI